MILCDTGPIVAAALADDARHHECVELFTGLHLARRPLLVPGTVVAEVGYLLARNAGARVESLFLQALAAGASSRSISVPRLPAGGGVGGSYADRLGTTDATVIALAERTGVDEVATLDRRHFTVVRPSHTPSLTLLL